jgi:integrase
MRVRRWHSGYRTKKDAERARTEPLARVDRGSYVEPSRLTVAVFLRKQWLPGLAGQVRPTTLHSYRTNLERYVLPRVGHVTLQRLTPAHLNGLYGALLAAGGKHGHLVFTREDGTPLHPEWLSDAFAWRVARAGLPRIRLHDLRHTHASLGLAAGVPVKVMSERLGHTSSSFTADAYQHVTPALEEQAAATVARLVFGP